MNPAPLSPADVTRVDRLAIDPRLQAAIVDIVSRLEFHRWGFGLAGSTYRTTPQNRLRRLTMALYECLYVRPRHDFEAPPRAGDQSDLLEQLALIDARRRRWERGWRVQRVERGAVLASRSGSVRWLPPGAWAVAVEAKHPRPGDLIDVLVPAGPESDSDYATFGLYPASDTLPRVRFYWSVRRQAAADLVRSIAAALDAETLPFSLKCFTAMPERTDRVVLYVPLITFSEVAGALAPVSNSLSTSSVAETPLCTKSLAPGWSTAADPGGRRSFGVSRCQLLALGLSQAHTEGCWTPEGAVKAVCDQFWASGIAPDRPYLSPYSVSDYSEGWDYQREGGE